MSEQHATPSRTDRQDISGSADCEPAEKYPRQREWMGQHTAMLSTLEQQRHTRAARKAEQMQQGARVAEQIGASTVGEIVTTIVALGLPGDPHPDRTTRDGVKYKVPGRAKQKEALRRQERLRFLEELKNLPVDEPLPVALTEKAEKILARRARGAA